MLHDEGAARQNANRKLHMQVTVLKHYNQNSNRKKAGSFPEVNCFNLNDYPPTSRYLHLHPVFKLVDSFLGPSRSSAMRRVNNTSNNGNKMPSLCYDGNNIGNKYTMRKSFEPNYNATGVHAVSVKNRQERIKTNMYNINTKNNLRLSLKGNSQCCRPKICEAEVERQEAKPHLAITDKYYVQQLKYEMKNNYTTKCSHLNEENTEYVNKLKEEMTVAKATISEEKRNTINELKNEINNYRMKNKTPSISSQVSKLSHRSSGSSMKNKKRKESITAPEPVKQVAGPVVEEKSDLDGPIETLWRSRVSLASSSDRESLVATSPKLNFEEKLEEANMLIDKVRKALRDLGVGGHKALRQRPAIMEAEEPVKECSINSTQSRCIGNTTCSFQGECCALILKKAEENQLKMAEEKTGDLKKFEEELRKKVEEEVSRKKEEECQKQLEEALRNQREELLQKLEEERETKKKEEERQQKQLEEVLRKQREELLQEVEEEREKKRKQEERQKEMEEALRKQREELLQEELEKKKKEEECQKQVEEALRKQREELLQKLEEEQEKKNKEEECQRQCGEALQKQREELLQKMEEELEKKRKEEVCQKQLEEALRKQREELLQKMEEELEKKKEEILQRRLPDEEMEVLDKNKDEIPSKTTREENMVDAVSEDTRKEAIMEEEEPRKKEELLLEFTEGKNLVEKESETKNKLLLKTTLETSECTCKKTTREQIPEKEVPVKNIDVVKQPESIVQEEKLEWIFRSDKDIIMDKPRNFESSLRSESYEMMEERLKTISEISLEDEEEEENKQNYTHEKRESSVTTIGRIERACSPLKCQLNHASLQDGDARSHCSTCMVTPSHSFSILHDEQKVPKAISTTSSSKSPKLAIQNLPPVNIRGGLVVQRTLNLTIKPTGSVTNTIGEDRSNIGYQEVNRGSEHGFSCPEDCKNMQGNCKYRVIENLIDAHQDEMPEKASIGFINKLNEEAILLLKSYQIYDQHNKHSSDDRSSATSLANLTHRLLRSLYESQLEEKGVCVGSSISEGCKVDNKTNTSVAGMSFASTMPSEQRTIETEVIKEEEEEEISSAIHSEVNYGNGVVISGSLRDSRMRDSRTSSELRSDAKEVLDNILKQSRTPSELGFYKTVATQMSNTSLVLVREKPSDASDFIRDGYSREWSMSETPSTLMSNPDWRKTVFGARKEETVEEMPVLEEEPVRTVEETPVLEEEPLRTVEEMPVLEEEPVRDKPLVEPVCSELSNSKRKVSLMVHSLSEESSSSSRSSEVSVVPEEAFRQPDLTQEPRKSILSNRCSVEESPKRYHKKSVSDTSSEENDSSSSSSEKARKDKEKAKNDVIGCIPDLSSTSSRSSSTSTIFDLKGKLGSDYKGERGSKRCSNYCMEESQQQPHGGEIKKKVDQEQQTSQASSSSTSTTTNSSSTDKVDTIKSFIQGLTGTSQEKLHQIRSNADFPKTDLQAWSKTVLKAEQRSSVVAPRTSTISEKSEREMGSLNYFKTQQEDATEELEGSDLVMSDHSDNKPHKSSMPDFHKFAKEALKTRRDRDAVVMMVTEERTMESGEGGNQRNLPFYKRVLGRVVEVEHPVEFRSIQSDPIPLDESFSEGEINCKCTVSSGEVHNCKFVPERRIKPLRKHPEDGGHKRETNDKSIRLARQRTQYNNWIQYYLQKRKSVRDDDLSISSSIDSP